MRSKLWMLPIQSNERQRDWGIRYDPGRFSSTVANTAAFAIPSLLKGRQQPSAGRNADAVGERLHHDQRFAGDGASLRASSWLRGPSWSGEYCRIPAGVCCASVAGGWWAQGGVVRCDDCERGRVRHRGHGSTGVYGQFLRRSSAADSLIAALKLDIGFTLLAAELIRIS
jgi:hypothetical protein